jgi:DNA-binding NtrC family response regulator
MFGDIANQVSLAKFGAQGRPPPGDTPLGAPPSGAHPSGNGSGEWAHFGALYGASEPMERLFRQMERLGRSLAPVVILGESGSGKELVAKTLHELSERASAPFVAVNCGAIPETLIESELFGHERGSFTGAARTHRGLFERASGGTLFLDEITEMPFEMQVRLLRVLETGRFCRVGGDVEIETDVRILAATNRDLQQAVSEKRLREDLMYRLCVVPLSVPPLRERGEDALLLADWFLAQLNLEHGDEKRFSEDASALILAHGWPGNVRELKNVVHRAFVLADGEISLDLGSDATPRLAESTSTSTLTLTATATGDADSALAPATPPRVNPGRERRARPGPIAPGAAGHTAIETFTVRIPVGMSLDDAERALIEATLRAVAGCKTKAAQVLGISPKTLYNKLHAYGNSASATETGAVVENQALAA